MQSVLLDTVSTNASMKRPISEVYAYSQAQPPSVLWTTTASAAHDLTPLTFPVSALPGYIPMDMMLPMVQRGSEELLGQSGGVSNGAIISPQTNNHTENNDAKKVKLDMRNTNGKPSRVIHIRNIPSEVTETEVIHLGMPFGKVTNVLVLKGKNQAFLEMSDEASASSMVSYFTSCPSNAAQLRGRSVYVQFSNHKELKTDQTHSNANASAQAAIQAAQALIGTTEIQGGPNTVLRVIIEHMVYPVTLDVLYQIFSRVGKVLKIVTFTKNNTFQALIQYPDVITAQAAKLSLDGQNIYNSCCMLRIEFSKLSSLNVKYNNDKSRDYTNPALPTGDPAIDAAMILGGAGGILPPFTTVHGLGSTLTSPYSSSPLTGVPGIPGFLGASANSLTAAAANLKLQNQLQNQLSQMTGGQIGGQISSVLCVNGLNEEMVTPDALFTLFGVYGDVQRVKIMFNKKDTALVQMFEQYQAQTAISHLDKSQLFGKQIRVLPSKHQSVQMPKEGQHDAGLTKDYTTSPLHRFKKPGSKNYMNIYPPSSTLHLSNIPSTTSEDDIKALFQENGYTVKNFRFFVSVANNGKDRKMALIELDSVEEGVTALIKLHNYNFGEKNYLRVSFSKSIIHNTTLAMGNGNGEVVY